MRLCQCDRKRWLLLELTPIFMDKCEYGRHTVEISWRTYTHFAASAPLTSARARYSAAWHELQRSAAWRHGAGQLGNVDDTERDLAPLPLRILWYKDAVLHLHNGTINVATPPKMHKCGALSAIGIADHPVSISRTMAECTLYGAGASGMDHVPPVRWRICVYSCTMG